jgi:hypothetical protein
LLAGLAVDMSGLLGAGDEIEPEGTPLSANGASLAPFVFDETYPYARAMPRRGRRVRLAPRWRGLRECSPREQRDARVLSSTSSARRDISGAARDVQRGE